MADLTPDHKRYKMFANRYLALNMGFSVGPMLGALLGIGGSTIAFVLTSVVYIIYAVVLFFLCLELLMIMNQYLMRALIYHYYGIQCVRIRHYYYLLLGECY